MNDHNHTHNKCDIQQMVKEIENIIKNNKWSSFKDSLIQLHNPKKIEDLDKNSLAYERISFDEIFSNLLIFSQIKKKNLTIYKKPKLFSSEYKLKILFFFSNVILRFSSSKRLVFLIF